MAGLVPAMRLSCAKPRAYISGSRRNGALFHFPGRVAEWFKAAVLKTARGFTLPRGFESHPFRHIYLKYLTFLPLA